MQVLHECLLELQCVPLDVIFWEDMAAELLIVDIKPETQNWTCRLTVVEKQNIRSAKTSPMKFLPLVLADSAGNRVQATAFAGDISGIDARLQLYSTYLISGAYVKPLTDLRFCVDQNYQYVWSFTRRTFIQDVAPEEGVDFRQIAESTVKPFRGIFDCYLAAESLSLMAVIVAKLPRAFIVTGDVHKVAWDVVLINEELTLVPMTIWEEFVNQHGAAIDTFLQSGDCPVLFVTRVVANIYQGLSLSTRYDSHMELNPVGDRALVLKKWAKDNNAKIKQLLIEKQYEHALENIACPLSQPQTLLASLETNLNKVPVVWVCGRVNLSDTSAEPYYIGCDYCNRRVYAPEGSTFQCMFCGQKQGRTVKRFILNATLTDGATTIPVTFFTNDVLKLYEYICMDPEKTCDLTALDAQLQNMTILAGVKRTKINEEGLRGNPFSVVCVSQEKTPIPTALPAGLASTSSNDAHIAPTKRKLAFPTKTSANIPSPLVAAGEGDASDDLRSSKRKT